MLQWLLNLGLDPKVAKRAGLLHDIGKVPEDEPELPHAVLGMKIAEKYGEKPDICNAIGAHHDEVEMTTLFHQSFKFVMLFLVQGQERAEKLLNLTFKESKILENVALSYPTSKGVIQRLMLFKLVENCVSW